MNTSHNHRYRVLVVDEEESVCRAIKLALICAGHSMRLVSNDLEALAVLEKNHFDLVILDRAMVGILGNDLAARIKQNWPRLPVVMTSAFAFEFNHSGRSFNNVDHILSKAFTEDELCAVIEFVIFQHKCLALADSFPGSLPGKWLRGVISTKPLGDLQRSLRNKIQLY